MEPMDYVSAGATGLALYAVYRLFRTSRRKDSDSIRLKFSKLDQVLEEVPESARPEVYKVLRGVRDVCYSLDNHRASIAIGRAIDRRLPEKQIKITQEPFD